MQYLLKKIYLYIDIFKQVEAEEKTFSLGSINQRRVDNHQDGNQEITDIKQNIIAFSIRNKHISLPSPYNLLLSLYNITLCNDKCAFVLNIYTIIRCKEKILIKWQCEKCFLEQEKGEKIKVTNNKTAHAYRPHFPIS